MSAERLDHLSIEDLLVVASGVLHDVAVKGPGSARRARVFCLLDGRDLTYTVDDAEQMMVEQPLASWASHRSRRGWQREWDPRHSAA